MSSNEISGLGNYSAGAGSDSKKSVETCGDSTALSITKKLSSETVNVSQGNSSTLSNSDRWNPKDFEPPSFISDGDQLTIFPLESEPPEPDDYQSIEEYEEAWQSWERSQKVEVTQSTKSTCAVELVSDSPLQESKTVQTSSFTQKLTNSATESFQNDTPLPPMPETLRRRQEFWKQLTGQASTDTISHSCSQPRLHASHSVLEESDSVQKMSEIASHQSLNLLEEFNQIISLWKTSPGCLLASLDKTQISCTPSLLDGRSKNLSTACKPFVFPVECFHAHLSESGSYWLPSPTALSSFASRPPGLNKLEHFMRKQNWLTNQEVINPRYLEKEFNIPLEWSNPENQMTAWELLDEHQTQDREGKRLEIVLTRVSQKSESTEYSSSTRSEVSSQRGCLYPYLQNKKAKDGTIKSYPKVEGERNPDNDKHWRWAYCWHDVSNGYKKRSISIPYSLLKAVRMLISSGIDGEESTQGDRIPQKVLQLVRCTPTD